MTTVTRPFKGCEIVRVVVKGAPEFVMKYCTKTFNEDGEIRDFEDGEADRILNNEIIDSFAKKGLRTFAYAYKDIDSDLWE